MCWWHWRGGRFKRWNNGGKYFVLKKSWINSHMILFILWIHQADILEKNVLTPCLLRALCIIQCLTPPFGLVTLQKAVAYLSCFGRGDVCYCVRWRDNQRVPTLHLSVTVCCLYVLSVSLSYTLFPRWRRQIQTRQKSVGDLRNRFSRGFLPGTRFSSCIKSVYTHFSPTYLTTLNVTHNVMLPHHHDWLLRILNSVIF